MDDAIFTTMVSPRMMVAASSVRMELRTQSMPQLQEMVELLARLSIQYQVISTLEGAGGWPGLPGRAVEEIAESLWPSTQGAQLWLPHSLWLKGTLHYLRQEWLTWLAPIRRHVQTLQDVPVPMPDWHDYS